MDDKQIEDACNFIRAYHFKDSCDKLFRTKEQFVHDQAEKIMNDTCGISPITILIKENNWKQLFQNQTWLELLDEAQEFSSLNSELNEPLRLLSESFRVETDGYIVPGLLK